MPKPKTKVSDCRPATAEPTTTPAPPAAEPTLAAFTPEVRAKLQEINATLDKVMEQVGLKKPATAAPEPSPRPLSHSQQYDAKQAEYKDRAEKLTAVLSFFESGHNLELFEYVQLIQSRDHGCTTPIEEFITKLIFHYGWADRGGHGLTMEDIDSQVETLREDLDDAIRASHFTASRYQKPEASNA